MENEEIKNELVSIITPSYNSKRFIKETYESVMKQSYTNWEWLIIDDCSTDDSFEFVKELVKDNSNIHVFKTEVNGGTAVARNIGLKNAKGRYITFLDSDDLLDPDYLLKQVAFIKDNGPIISAGYRRMAANSTTNFVVPNEISYKKLLNGNPLSCLTTMYDREVVGEHYFPENIRKPEDYVFWLDMLKEGYTAKGNPEILATYRIVPGSKSSNKFKLIKCMYVVYHKTQKLNWFVSWYHVIRWAFYGLRKYKNVK